MYNLMKNTYTLETLKENILKVLGEFSVNGSESSYATGFLADAEKKLIATLNICLRRVVLSLPLLEKSVELQFASGKAILPEDFVRADGLFVNGIGQISDSAYRIIAGSIECAVVSEGGFATLTYKVSPTPFTPDLPSWTRLDLPDITADALCYLTAAELCPPEYGELYSKLMYKYRDICLNCYGYENNTGKRNSFFGTGARRRFGIKVRG